MEFCFVVHLICKDRFMRVFLLIVVALAFVSCQQDQQKDQQNNSSYELNAIIGNEALDHIPDERISKMSEADKIKAHLSYVCEYLMGESEKYPEEVKQKRLRLLSLLATYISAEDYPLNEAYEGRRPCFIDAYGNYCAVGYLVKETAGESIAKDINEQHQYDYIYDMNMTVLDNWIKESGFTKREIAMIQPSYEFFGNRNYHTASFSTEVRNGNLPNIGWGYHYVKYHSQGSMLGGHWMRSYGAVINHYRNGGWSGGVETERSLVAVKNIGLSLNIGFGARYLNLDDQSFLQGVPSASMNLLFFQKRTIFFDLAALYQYGIPLLNQRDIHLNRHAFVFRLRVGLSQN